MQKKSSKKKPPAKSLLARAKAIIDSDAYDTDTRESIKYELKTNYSGLADMVERAEQGETICDTLRVERDYRKAAHQVIALCNKSAAPDFLTAAMIEVLDEASKIKGIQIFSDKNPQGTEDFDAKALAELFEAALAMELRTPRSRLARAISEILNNKLTPTRLYNEVGNFVTDVSNKLMDDSPEIIGKILAFGECGYTLCPGTTDGSVCPGLEAHPKDSEKDKE